MNTIQFQTGAKKHFAANAMAPRAENPTDAAWLVLEAANDLGDQAAVDACRRVIDANLNGTIAAPSDMHLVLEYFR
ncbi:MAG: hypothetical protein HY852_15820 [Bradyrhizobium sp.]|uniref:hypothetical protein n=1 Tax=Bradyrhizobium sp. TaxID=376 RepID=UPI0025C6233A|nr:hypothetical protein [Bradyrhizobium sp.]MBI5263279.1 hypothetical protein [Bradyrhizobium sp.]